MNHKTTITYTYLVLLRGYPGGLSNSSILLALHAALGVGCHGPMGLCRAQFMLSGASYEVLLPILFLQIKTQSCGSQSAHPGNTSTCANRHVACVGVVRLSDATIHDDIASKPSPIGYVRFHTQNTPTHPQKKKKPQKKG